MIIFVRRCLGWLSVVTFLTLVSITAGTLPEPAAKGDAFAVLIGILWVGTSAWVYVKHIEGQRSVKANVINLVLFIVVGYLGRQHPAAPSPPLAVAAMVVLFFTPIISLFLFDWSEWWRDVGESSP